uniref:Uncharacterized protein n=1 Tax=Timema bartmani TaxID=61472 RepID=A0A7R9FF95_9NEOP|nr:unnamed protein product [Timema bartmani]
MCYWFCILTEKTIKPFKNNDTRVYFSYESADGTRVSEQGILKPNADGTDNVLVKQGSFSYISPEGQPISLSYIADELGFRPKGDHLPVAPTV